jgi:hypothetical protein
MNHFFTAVAIRSGGEVMNHFFTVFVFSELAAKYKEPRNRFHPARFCANQPHIVLQNPYAETGSFLVGNG